MPRRRRRRRVAGGLRAYGVSPKRTTGKVHRPKKPKHAAKVARKAPPGDPLNPAGVQHPFNNQGPGATTSSNNHANNPTPGVAEAAAGAGAAAGVAAAGGSRAQATEAAHAAAASAAPRPPKITGSTGSGSSATRAAMQALGIPDPAKQGIHKVTTGHVGDLAEKVNKQLRINTRREKANAFKTLQVGEAVDMHVKHDEEGNPETETVKAPVPKKEAAKALEVFDARIAKIQGRLDDGLTDIKTARDHAEIAREDFKHSLTQPQKVPVFLSKQDEKQFVDQMKSIGENTRAIRSGKTRVQDLTSDPRPINQLVEARHQQRLRADAREIDTHEGGPGFGGLGEALGEVFGRAREGQTGNVVHAGLGVPDVNNLVEISAVQGLSNVINTLTKPGAATETAVGKGLVEAGIIDEDSKSGKRISKAPSIDEALSEGFENPKVVRGADLIEGLGGPRWAGLAADIVLDPVTYIGAGAALKGVKALEEAAKLEALAARKAPQILKDQRYLRYAAMGRRSGDYTELRDYMQAAIKARGVKGYVRPKSVRGRMALHTNRTGELAASVRQRLAKATEEGQQIGRNQKAVLPGKALSEAVAQTYRSAKLHRSIKPGFRFSVGNPLRPIDRPLFTATVPFPKVIKLGKKTIDLEKAYSKMSNIRTLREVTRVSEAQLRLLDQRGQEQLMEAIQPILEHEGGLPRARSFLDLTHSQQQSFERVGLYMLLRHSHGGEAAAARILKDLDPAEQKVVANLDKMTRAQALSGRELGILHNTIPFYSPQIWQKGTKDFAGTIDPRDPNSSFGIGSGHGTSMFADKHRSQPDFAALASEDLLTDAIKALSRHNLTDAQARAFAKSTYREAKDRAQIEVLARELERGEIIHMSELTDDEIRMVKANSGHEDALFRDPLDTDGRLKLSNDAYKTHNFSENAYDLPDAAARKMASVEQDIARLKPVRRNVASDEEHDLAIAGENEYPNHQGGVQVEGDQAVTGVDEKLSSYKLMLGDRTASVQNQLDRLYQHRAALEHQIDQLEDLPADQVRRRLAKINEAALPLEDRMDEIMRAADLRPPKAPPLPDAPTWRMIRGGEYETADGEVVISKINGEWIAHTAKNVGEDAWALDPLPTLARAKAAAEASIRENFLRKTPPVEQGFTPGETAELDQIQAELNDIDEALDAERRNLDHALAHNVPRGHEDYGPVGGSLEDVRKDDMFPVLDPRVTTFYRTRAEAVNAAYASRWQGIDKAEGVSMTRARKQGWTHSPDKSIWYDKQGRAYRDIYRKNEGKDNIGQSIQKSLGGTSDRLWPSEVLDAARAEAMRLGEDDYARAFDGMLDAGYMHVLGLLRYGVTTPFPAFHIRNMFSDVLKSFQAGGAGLIFHPLASAQGAYVMARGGKTTLKIPGTKIELKISNGKLKVPGFDEAMPFEDFMFIADLFGIRSGQHFAEYMKLAQTGNPTSNTRKLATLGHGAGLGPQGVIGKRLIEMGAKREDIVRYLTFAQRMRTNGADVAEAAWYMTKHHFDYGNLTAFEKNKIRNLFMFYTWYRKNIPLQFGELISRPGFFAGVGNTYYDMPAGETPMNQDWSKIAPWLPDMSGPMPMKGIVPDYMLNPLAALQTNWNGHAAAFAFAAPWADMNLVTNMLRPGQFEAAAKQAASMANPLLAMILSEAYGTDPLTGRKYKQYEPVADPVAGAVEALSKVGINIDVRTNPETGQQMIPFQLQAILRNMPILGRAAGYGLSGTGTYDTGNLQKYRGLVGALGGITSYVSPDKSRLKAEQAELLGPWLGKQRDLSFAISNQTDAEKAHEKAQFEVDLLAYAKQHNIPRSLLEETFNGLSFSKDASEKSPTKLDLGGTDPTSTTSSPEFGAGSAADDFGGSSSGPGGDFGGTGLSFGEKTSKTAKAAKRQAKLYDKALDDIVPSPRMEPGTVPKGISPERALARSIKRVGYATAAPITGPAKLENLYAESGLPGEMPNVELNSRGVLGPDAAAGYSKQTDTVYFGPGATRSIAAGRPRAGTMALHEFSHSAQDANLEKTPDLREGLSDAWARATAKRLGIPTKGTMGQAYLPFRHQARREFGKNYIMEGQFNAQVEAPPKGKPAVDPKVAKQIVRKLKHAAANTTQIEADLTPDQMAFAKAFAKASGMSPQLAAAAVLYEGGNSDSDSGDQNWLNIGHTDSGNAEVTTAPEFRDPVQAGTVSGKWINGEWGQDYGYVAAPAIQQITSNKGDAAQMDAWANSGWASSGAGPGLTYDQVSVSHEPIPKGLKSRAVEELGAKRTKQVIHNATSSPAPAAPSVKYKGKTVKLDMNRYSGSRDIVRLVTGSPHLRGDHGGTKFGEAPGQHAANGDHYRPDGYAQDINGDNPRENEPPFSQETMDTIVANLRALGAKDVPDLQIGEGGTWEVQGYSVYVEPVSNHIHVGAHPIGDPTGAVDVSGAGIASPTTGATGAPVSPATGTPTTGSGSPQTPAQALLSDPGKALKAFRRGAFFKGAGKAAGLRHGSDAYGLGKAGSQRMQPQETDSPADYTAPVEADIAALVEHLEALREDR